MSSFILPESMGLQEQVTFYSDLLDKCSDLIHRVTSEGRFLYVNQAWKDTLGYSSEEIKNLSLMDIVDDSCKGKCQKVFDALICGEHVERNETVFVTRDGRKISVEGSCRTTFEGGKPVAMTGIFRDISDRVKNDIALQASEIRFRTLFDNSSDIMQIVSADGRFLHVNPAWLEAFGYTREEVKKLTIFDLIDPECQNHCIGVFQQVISEDRVHRIDTVFIGKNGNKIEIEGNARGIFDEEGNALQSQCLFRDVTAKRKMEKELLRTRKLESIGVFAGGLAHDFNNLLTAVLGNISLARAASQEDTVLDERLEKIETATLRAKGLTQQLLTFAKGGEPIKKLSGIEDVVRDSVEFPLRGSNIKREYAFSPDLWDAEVDEDQLSQVIQNLVLNAAHAMPDGGCLRVSGENVDLPEEHHTGLDTGPYVLISVTDEGHGISQLDQERIFDPYYSSKVNGSGLGLAVAYAIMKKHDGSITVESEPGMGAVFSLYLPASPAKQQVLEKQIQEQDHVGGNILIMDDEDIVCDVAEEMLKFMGYNATSVADGEQALQAYKEALETGKPFDAVLMDLTIPGGMGGRETMARLLEIDPQARGIASSGYANDPIMARFKDYGFSGVVPKPYKLDEIRSTLARLLAPEH